MLRRKSASVFKEFTMSELQTRNQDTYALTTDSKQGSFEGLSLTAL